MTNNAAVLPVNNNISVSPYFATVAVTGAAYTMMELIRHGLVEGYLVPWLSSMGLSAAMVTYLSYAMVVIGIAAIAYLIYKMFIAKEE